MNSSPASSAESITTLPALRPPCVPARRPTSMIISSCPPTTPRRVFETQALLRLLRQHAHALLWGSPGIRVFTVMRGDGEGDLFLIGRLIFNTVDDLRAAISGEYRAVYNSRDLQESLTKCHSERCRAE